MRRQVGARRRRSTSSRSGAVDAARGRRRRRSARSSGAGPGQLDLDAGIRRRDGGPVGRARRRHRRRPARRSTAGEQGPADLVARRAAVEVAGSRVSDGGRGRKGGCGHDHVEPLAGDRLEQIALAHVDGDAGDGGVEASRARTPGPRRRWRRPSPAPPRAAATARAPAPQPTSRSRPAVEGATVAELERRRARWEAGVGVTRPARRRRTPMPSSGTARNDDASRPPPTSWARPQAASASPAGTPAPSTARPKRNSSASAARSGPQAVRSASANGDAIPSGPAEADAVNTSVSLPGIDQQRLDRLGRHLLRIGDAGSGHGTMQRRAADQWPAATHLVVSAAAMAQRAILCYLESDGALALEAIDKLRTVAPTEVLPMPTVAQVLETVEHTPGSAGHAAHRGQLRGRGAVGLRPARLRVVERLHPRRGRRVRQPRRLRRHRRRGARRPTPRCRARGASSTASGSCRSTGSGCGTPTRRPRRAALVAASARRGPRRHRADPRRRRVRARHRRRRHRGPARPQDPLHRRRPRGRAADRRRQDHPRRHARPSTAPARSSTCSRRSARTT